MGQEESTIVDESAQPVTLSERSLSAVAEYILNGRKKKIVVLTGAGISTAAGIPDFRSPETGLYSNLARLNLPYAEAVFDISYFRQHPQPFYVLARELYPGKFHPTVSHAFIALLAQKGLLQMLFTQNIDCLERRAGVPAAKIIEAHGSFASQRCIECKTTYPDDEMTAHVSKGMVAQCNERDCRGTIKPDIVFFGEALPSAFSDNAHQTALADLVLVVGTSLTVYPFAGLPEMAKEGTPRVLFNMEKVGKLGCRPDDVVALGSCDASTRKLADELGWREELENYWRGVVGDEEADAQLRRAETPRDEVDEEVHRLANGIESALELKNSDTEDDTPSKEAESSVHQAPPPAAPASSARSSEAKASIRKAAHNSATGPRQAATPTPTATHGTTDEPADDQVSVQQPTASCHTTEEPVDDQVSVQKPTTTHHTTNGPADGHVSVQQSSPNGRPSL